MKIIGVEFTKKEDSGPSITLGTKENVSKGLKAISKHEGVLILTFTDREAEVVTHNNNTFDLKSFADYRDE